MNKRILSILKNADTPVSGQTIAGELNISRTAVWKHIKKLRAIGYEIIGHPKVGYKLAYAPDIIVCEELESVLSPDFRDQVVCFDCIESTNDTAKEMASAGKLHPVGLVVAEEQVGGRGRFRRPWVSPRGGIWISLVIRPHITPAAAGKVAIAAAVAVAEAIIEIASVDAKVKWPNDILINGKKVCGILTEMAGEFGQIEYLVIGIGINANFHTSELSGNGIPATTLMDECSRPINRILLIKEIVAQITAGLIELEDNYSGILRRWKELSDTIGRHVALDTGGRIINGLAVDLDKDGRLILELASGDRKAYSTGEVTMSK